MSKYKVAFGFTLVFFVVFTIMTGLFYFEKLQIELDYPRTHQWFTSWQDANNNELLFFFMSVFSAVAMVAFMLQDLNSEYTKSLGPVKT